MSARYNLVVEQATTFNFQFTIKNNGTPWNLTNYTATMTVRPFVGATTTTLVATTENGRITLNGGLGQVTVTLSAQTTGAIRANTYAYDLILDSGTEITRILEGQFIVTGAVTTSV